jgi:hypothetical protein
MGDVCESTGLFRYATNLWGPKPDIHWYVQRKFRKPLDHNPDVTVHEIHGGPDMIDMAEEGIKRGAYDKVYRTAPWLNMGMVWDVPLPRIPRMVLGLDKRHRSWRPVVYITHAELLEARRLTRKWGQSLRVMLETDCFSHQGEWTDDLSRALIDLLRRYKPVYFTASFGYAPRLKGLGARKVVGLDKVTYRALTEVYNGCSMFVGVASGTASVTCADRCCALPRVELIEKRRCPGWGTSAMMPSAPVTEPDDVLRAVQQIAERWKPTSRKLRRRLMRGVPARVVG